MTMTYGEEPSQQFSFIRELAREWENVYTDFFRKHLADPRLTRIRKLSKSVSIKFLKGHVLTQHTYII